MGQRVKVRVLFESEVIATLEPEQTKVSLSFPKQRAAAIYDDYRNGRKPPVTFQVWTAEGWCDDWTQKTEGPDSTFIFEVGKQHFDFDVHPLPQTTLCVDNRGGSEVKIACGEWEAVIAPEKTGEMLFPSPRVPKTLALYLGGRDVGQVLTGKTYLLDCSGNRSYKWAEHLYGYSPNAPFPKSPMYFRKDHLHELPDSPNYFLSPAPMTTTSNSPGAIEFRYELLETSD